MSCSDAHADAIAEAKAFDVEIGQLRESLKRKPEERPRELDASISAVRELESRQSVGKGHDEL